ncbi:MAG: hypothetical protein B7Y84_02090 [Azorhizobium sp. 32-67-21]|nr:MAG: hypothetical protein B7Z30_02950 [Rhizobiales bacterium 12-68-15]OYX90187.1 MAG: hypothetical protein B7Y84_02090 [Azorhizobium sp. 32-67-21]
MGKMNAPRRKQLIERLVALNGGRPAARKRYEAFSDETLVRALELEGSAAREIAARGRLAAVWSEDGTAIDAGEEISGGLSERARYVDRLVELNGGSEAVREVYSSFPDAALKEALASAEHIMSRWRSPLEGKWNDVGDEKLTDPDH